MITNYYDSLAFALRN